MRRAALAILVWLASALLVPTAAVADGVVVSDGNDTPAGSLDIRRTNVEHDGRSILHRVDTFEAFSPASLADDEALIGIAIDTNGDPRDVERLAMVVGGSRFRGVVTTGSGRRLIATARVLHPTSRSVVIRLQRSALPRGTTDYRWFAFASTNAGGNCCTDSAPDRDWLWHDIAAPTIDGPSIQVFQTVPSSTVVPVSFAVSDAGGSGLASWTLRTRVIDSDGWTDSATGSEEEVTTSFTGEEGVTYHLCVKAVDRAGNESGLHPGALASIPFDDARFTYSGEWTSSADPTDFAGTRHETATPGATAQIVLGEGLGSDLVVPPGHTGRVRVTVNGAVIGDILYSAKAEPRQLSLDGVDPSDLTLASNVVTFELVSGTFGIDGIRVLPHLPSSTYTSCG